MNYHIIGILVFVLGVIVLVITIKEGDSKKGSTFDMSSLFKGLQSTILAIALVALTAMLLLKINDYMSRSQYTHTEQVKTLEAEIRSFIPFSLEKGQKSERFDLRYKEISHFSPLIGGEHVDAELETQNGVFRVRLYEDGRTPDGLIKKPEGYYSPTENKYLGKVDYVTFTGSAPAPVTIKQVWR